MKCGAFFDVDGTLVSCQTQQKLACRLRSNGLLSQRQNIRISLWYVLYRLGFIKKSTRIRQDVYQVLSTKPKSEIDHLITRTFTDLVEPNINSSLNQHVMKHKSNGCYVAAISGTLDLLCRLVCQKFGINEYFATQLVVQGERYTGQWNGDILDGEAKARLVHKLAREKELDLKSSYAYSDSFSDLPFLNCVGNPVVVSSKDKKLFKHAKKHGWEIIDTNAS